MIHILTRILCQISKYNINTKQKPKMQVIEFFTRKKTEQIEAIDFTPSIIVSPTSTLFIECTPNDPHTASNIVINCYPSKTDRSLLQARMQWRRFKIITDNEHTNTQLPFITGNTYRCEPADLGFYIQAKIVSCDVACSGSAEVTIGPIRLDPTVKTLIEGALYSRSLRSQIKILQKNETRNVDMMLTDRYIKFTDQLTNKQLEMSYDMHEPKIEVNPKDPVKIFLRFERDTTNRVQSWLETICQNPNFDTQSRKSYGSSGSSSKIFKNSGSVNKIQIIFLTRHSRDQFIFSLKAFVCKEQIRNSAAIESLQNVAEMKTPADAHKFFQFMSFRSQIYRLASLAKRLQKQLSKKIKDLEETEDNFASATTQYIQMIEKKAKEFNLDLNQTHSEISIRREQIMGKKQMRELQAENERLKIQLRDKYEENQFKEYLLQNKNESMMLNQTRNNPFVKKNTNDSYYGPNMAYENEEAKQQSPNVAELTKSYLNLLKENEKLKEERKVSMVQNVSMSKDLDMLNLLESLHEADEQPNVIINKLKAENKSLRVKIEELMDSLQKNKTNVGIKLNQSVAYKQQQQKKQKSFLGPEESFLSRQQPEGSFLSLSQSNLNDSMTSEAALMALENKVKQIGQKNKQVLAQNQRLRGQRNRYKQQCQKLMKVSGASNNQIQQRSVLSTSNYFDPEGLKQQNQNLINEKNSLLRKIQSITKQSAKGDPLLERKCQQLTKENNYLRKENQSLRQKIETMKSQSVSLEQSTENYKQNDKLKKINSQLLEEIKKLKLEVQRKQNPLYNSRVIELENQLKFVKNSGGGAGDVQKATQDLLTQITKLQKELEKLNRDNSDKQAKIISQTTLIENLMNAHGQNSQSVSGKDKSYSETRNDSQSNEKLKKKIKQLQEQIVMMRRSADALNRSEQMSRDMISYNDQQIDLLKRERDMIIQENQKLSRMCQKYSKDARQSMKQLVKWKQQAFDLMKTQQPKQQL